jgi:hypothetical protein
MKPHNSTQVVRMWCSIRTSHILRCFNNPEGLSYGDLLVDVVPELINSQRLATAVPSQDLGGDLVVFRG